MQADLRDAIAKALSGDWDGAHAIVQRHETAPLACWIHAVLHKIEGDSSNSRYWYARTNGRRYEDYEDPGLELRDIAATLSA